MDFTFSRNITLGFQVFRNFYMHNLVVGAVSSCKCTLTSCRVVLRRARRNFVDFCSRPTIHPHNSLLGRSQICRLIRNGLTVAPNSRQQFVTKAQQYSQRILSSPTHIQRATTSASQHGSLSTSTRGLRSTTTLSVPHRQTITLARRTCRRQPF